MSRAVFFTAILVLTITTVAPGCTGLSPEGNADPLKVPAAEATAVPAPDVTCEKEAEQLLKPVRVFAAPGEDAPEQAELRAGRMIYRCGRQNDWISITYPAEGEPVDCSLRTGKRRCALGWVRGRLPTSTFG